MKGNATVMETIDKKRGYKRYFINIPSNIVKALDIKKFSIVDFEIGNTGAISQSNRGLNFKKKAKVELENVPA